MSCSRKTVKIENFYGFKRVEFTLGNIRQGVLKVIGIALSVIKYSFEKNKSVRISMRLLVGSVIYYGSFCSAKIKE